MMFHKKRIIENSMFVDPDKNDAKQKCVVYLSSIKINYATNEHNKKILNEYKKRKSYQFNWTI